MPDDVIVTPKVKAEVGADGFIPGTTYKSVDDLLKGHLELKKTYDAQGNELGQIRKDHDSLKGQTETLATILKENLSKGQAPAAAVEVPVDYGTEILAVEEQIQKLDPMDKDYQRTLATLVAKTNKLTALDTKDKTLRAANDIMKKELNDRDVKAAHEAFHRDNPTFNTPEMQVRIKEYIVKDKTGMSDPLSAFREIQRDDIAAEAARLRTENAEYLRLVNLNKGKDEAGKVVVTTQSSPQLPAQKAKVTGKELDTGMMAVLKASKGS